VKFAALALSLVCVVASAECRTDRRDRRVNRLRADCGGPSVAACTFTLSPPAGYALWQDATQIDGTACDSSLSTGTALASWAVSDAGTIVSPFTAAGAAQPRLTKATYEVSFDGVQNLMTSSGSKSTTKYFHAVARKFDLLISYRVRNTTNTNQRRILGNAEGQKGIVVLLTEAHKYKIIINNGTSDIVNYTTTTISAPQVGSTGNLLIRGDGTNLLLSTDLTTFPETVAFSNAGATGDAFYDFSLAGGSPTQTYDKVFEGDFRQVVAYDNVNLSAGELTTLRAFVAERSPSSTQNVWAALGDSLTLTATATYPWPARLDAALRPTIGVANQGVSGATVAEAYSRYLTQIANRGFTGVVIQIGINDITAGTSAATIEATYGLIIANAVALGMPVVLLTNTSFGSAADWTAPRQTELVALRVWIAAQAALHVTVVDLAASMSTGLNLSAAYDYGDGKHYNDTGAAFISSTLAAILPGLSNFAPACSDPTSACTPGRSNYALYSKDFGNAIWVPFSSGGASQPTVVTDTDLEPTCSGNRLADRVTFGATGAADRSVLYAISRFSGAGSLGVWVKGVSLASGTIDVTNVSTTTACAYTNTAWTFCCAANVAQINGGTTPWIGNDSIGNGGTARPAQTVMLWQGQLEAGATCTGPIPTTSATVTCP
jgi:lysophospholipase L1-like esterase